MPSSSIEGWGFTTISGAATRPFSSAVAARTSASKCPIWRVACRCAALFCPAKQLGIDDKVGSIKVGKSGDVVLFDQHPLSNYSKVLKVWIDGHEYFDRDKDLQVRKEPGEKKKTLLEKEKAASKAEATKDKPEPQPKAGRKPREKKGNPDSLPKAAH